MKQLGEDILQEGFDSNNIRNRDASRAIIFNDKREVLVIYSSFYDDISFPGGGVEDGESLITTLYRESLEEVGAVIDSHKEYYKIIEKRKDGSSRDDYNVFTSYYYICTYKELIQSSLLDYEIELGYEARWVSLEDAIKLNTNTMNKLKSNNKYFGVVERELRILRELNKTL